MPRPYARPELRLAARVLRGSMTDAEHCLWARLRRKQLDGVQFYRQRPIGSYITDFYAPAVRLVIELDGLQHLQSKQVAYDRNRTTALAAMGLRVMRFDNRRVLSQTQAVVGEILQAIRGR